MDNLEKKFRVITCLWIIGIVLIAKFGNPDNRYKWSNVGFMLMGAGQVLVIQVLVNTPNRSKKTEET